jgi:type IV secretory pathway VirB4 component
MYLGHGYARSIIITKYPSSADIGWLKEIASLPGTVFSLYAAPIRPDVLINAINKSVQDMQAVLKEGNVKADRLSAAEHEIEDAMEMLERITRSQESVVDVCISLLVLGQTQEELDKRYNRVNAIISGYSFRARIPILRQEEGLLAVAPWSNAVTPVTAKYDSRNMPISTLAAALPFATTGLNDGKGFILGRDMMDNLIMLDIWSRGPGRRDRMNENIVVLGTSGSGKSTAIKHFILNQWAMDVQVIVIDPEHEYFTLCKSVDGQYIDASGGKSIINMFDLKDETTAHDDDDDELDMNTLARQMQILRTFFRLYLKGIEEEELAVIEELIEKLYAERGITYDSIPQNISRSEFPTMGELYEKLDKDKHQKVATLLRRAAIGSDNRLFNGTSNVRLQSGFTVIDTSGLQESDEVTKRAQFYNILTWCWSEIKKARASGRRILLAVDEAHLLVDPDVPQTIQFLRSAAKRARKYNTGIVTITQSIVDFLDPAVKRFGQALLDNACYKLLMGADGQNLEEISKQYNLTRAEQDVLAAKLQRHGVLIAGNKRVHAVVNVPQFELDMFDNHQSK